MNDHHYLSDNTKDVYGYSRCVHCGLPRRNQVHAMPERDPEEAVLAARIIGEGTDS